MQFQESSTVARVSRDKHVRTDDLVSIIPYATLRIRKSQQLPIEEHANAIASHLQLSNRLMQDDPESEQLRIETLRAMPQCLVIKRSVKFKLQTTVNEKSRKKSIGYWTQLKYKCSLIFGKIYGIIQDTAPRIELWYQSIKSIEGRFGSGVATYFRFLRWLIILNTISCTLSILFVVLPQSLDQVSVNSTINGWDFLTGSGFLSDTIMYYGFYTNSTVEKVYGSVYSIPSAYFLTLFLSYILTFVILSMKVLSSYQKCYVEVRGKVHNLYSNKIFAGWDYTISSSKAAQLQSASIYRELIELLADAEQHIHRNRLAKLCAIVVQAAVTIIVLGIICGTGVLLWMLLDKTETVSVMIVPIIVTVIINIFPAVIACLTKLERYRNKRTELYTTVIRIHAMAASIVITLFAYWLTSSATGCWQTKFGEEIYRLIVLDFFACTFGDCFVESMRAVLRKLACKDIERSTFDIAHNTLNLIYNQTLFWLGYYFSPPMSLIIILKMILTFYVRKHDLMTYYKPPPRPWRAAQMQTLFLALAFLGKIGVLIMLGYIIMHVQSSECGPFRGYRYTWDFVIDGFLSLEKDSTFWKAVSLLMRPATGSAILIGMCIGVYWLRAKVEASKEMLHILKEMLELQSRDKEFLLKSFDKVTDHRYTPSYSDGAEMETFPSSSEDGTDVSPQSRQSYLQSTNHGKGT